MSIEIVLLKQIIECAILASGEPVTIDRIQQLFPEEERPGIKEIREALESLAEDAESRGLVLKEVSSGYVFQIKAQMQQWIGKLWEKRPPKYSRALLETLALVAYRQPITRAEIEEVRGVSIASTTFKILMEREWIRVVGHRDVPGKPALYATTKAFLDYFNLKSLEELPPLVDLQATLTALQDNPEISVDAIKKENPESISENAQEDIQSEESVDTEVEAVSLEMATEAVTEEENATENTEVEEEVDIVSAEIPTDEFTEAEPAIENTQENVQAEDIQLEENTAVDTVSLEAPTAEIIEEESLEEEIA